MAQGDQFEFNIDDREVQLMLRKAPEKVRETIKLVLTAGAIDTQAHAREEEAPTFDGGLKRNIKVRIFKDHAEVSSDAKYSAPIEYGRKAGKHVPMKQGVGLWKWAESKGIPPFAVARSIFKKGTKPNPFMQRTHDIMKPKVESLAERQFGQMIKELNT